MSTTKQSVQRSGKESTSTDSVGGNKTSANIRARKEAARKRIAEATETAKQQHAEATAELQHRTPAAQQAKAIMGEKKKPSHVASTTSNTSTTATTTTCSSTASHPSPPSIVDADADWPTLRPVDLLADLTALAMKPIPNGNTHTQNHHPPGLFSATPSPLIQTWLDRSSMLSGMLPILERQTEMLEAMSTEVEDVLRQASRYQEQIGQPRMKEDNIVAP